MGLKNLYFELKPDCLNNKITYKDLCLQCRTELRNKYESCLKIHRYTNFRSLYDVNISCAVMNYFSVHNMCMKPHNSFMLPEAPPRNIFFTEKKSPTTSNVTIEEVWKHNFKTDNQGEKADFSNSIKTSWGSENIQQEHNNHKDKKVDETHEVVKTEDTEQVCNDRDDEGSPSHHARRPMNAFLIFCKKHRPVVRQRFPTLENRGVTRILGEWWALLDSDDKRPYTDLAKEYKDAFLTANPDFKWYKLPAPPLRTLATRPPSSHKISLPISSPSTHNLVVESEFNPGKLADESQLGGLTSLMNNNFTSGAHNLDCCEEKTENNNNRALDRHEHQYDSSQLSPVNLIKTTLPPKPIKKRFIEKHIDNRNVSKNLMENNEEFETTNWPSNNLTKQDLLDKVVDSIFERDSDFDGLKSSKDIRKSERVCKGKRYEKFMVEGKLLGNKRDTKLTQQRSFDTPENEINNRFAKLETPKLDLENTIKRLAERTNVKLDFDSREPEKPIERVRTISETSDSSLKNSSISFDLNLRIQNLPSLSYDVFLQRKRENKKRKIRTKGEGESKSKTVKIDRAVGSKKRKNKQTIIHLEKKDETSVNNDLLGLATLAEVAANTEKIG